MIFAFSRGASLGRHLVAMAVAVCAMAAGVFVLAPPASAAGPVPHYLMTAFTNSSESNMNIYDSPDATTFSVVRANAYTPPSGLVRDPSVMRHTDGRYYLVYTTGWTGDTIGFAVSNDGVAWTFLRNLTVGLNGSTGSTWAPEWFKDSNGSVHVIFSASTTGTAGQFSAYLITATDGSLANWTSRAPLGIGANHIDTFVVKSGSTYHAFVKNETTKYIEHATAAALTGPWKIVGSGNWAGWGSGLEGPAVVRLPNGGWRLYFDNYGAGHYYYADSQDLNTFTAKKELPGLSGIARHFTVLREDVGDGTTLPAGPTSLRSVNFPDRYLRHRDNLAYVDPITTGSPLADRRDATFTVTAGLAASSCVSFQAVNFPGSYLRHANSRLTLQANNGTPLFAADATFCPRAGLAGGSSISLESFNYPGRFLRHANYEIWLDPRQSTSTFNADASFTTAPPLS